MKLEVEHDGKGNHRIVATKDNGMIIKSEFVGYSNIATIKVENSNYIAVSQYFEGNGVLRPETVYIVHEVKNY